jgi:hypothetical protein
MASFHRKFNNVRLFKLRQRLLKRKSNRMPMRRKHPDCVFLTKVSVYAWLKHYRSSVITLLGTQLKFCWPSYQRLAG